MVGLVLAVVCHRQEEFPGTLIPLSTLPSKPMLKEPMTLLHDLTLPYLTGVSAHTPEVK